MPLYIVHLPAGAKRIIQLLQIVLMFGTVQACILTFVLLIVVVFVVVREVPVQGEPRLEPKDCGAEDLTRDLPVMWLCRKVDPAMVEPRLEHQVRMIEFTCMRVRAR